MAFSSVGIGSGLQVDQMVAQLVALEKKPLTQLQTKASSLNAKVSAYGQLQSQLSNLQTQVEKLTSAATWHGKTLTSSNASLVTGVATTKASNVSFDVSVRQMASGQVVGSGVVASGSHLGTGTLTFQLGEWEGSTLKPKMQDGQQATVSVQITEQEDSLAKIAAKINQSNAGVTATVLRDHNGERLSLQSNATGGNAGFSVAVSQATGTGLEQFAYKGVDAGMKRSQVAQDTVATINGVEMNSRTRTFEDVAEGISLTVAQKMAETDAPVRVIVAGDTATAKTALKSLVDSYNALSGALSIMTAYNPDTKTSGTLQGDSTAVNLQSALRRMLGSPNGQSGAFRTLSDMGLAFQSDGSLKIDDATLDKALNKPDEMARFFVAGQSDGQDGWAVRLKDFTQGLLSSSGMLATKSTSLKEALKSNAKDQDRVNDRASSVEKRLLEQYTRLDMSMSKLSALDAYVSQQVTTWNKQKY